MLHDRSRIHVQAGAGGDGCASFRREAHVPRGGPDGGDGGRGGGVVLVCDDSLRDLQGFRRKTHYRAGRGGHGEGALRHGADGETLVIRVPPGTQITGLEEEEGDLGGRRWELLAAGQRVLVARGGAGGKGNKRFATPTRQAPRFAERGLAGEEGWLELRLKLLADVGLVGMPNAGKSSLLARLTRAAPKVAAYPFTTLSPVLGVLEGDERQLVLADIPGLIEGASEGAGIGARLSGPRRAHSTAGARPRHRPRAVRGRGRGRRGELRASSSASCSAHDERLARLPRVLALSKADLVTDERAGATVAEWERRLGPGGAGDRHLERDRGRASTSWPVRCSGPSRHRARERPPLPSSRAPSSSPSTWSSGRRRGRVSRSSGSARDRSPCAAGASSGCWRGMTLDNEDAMAYFEGRLERIGVLKALEDEGFQPGDEIEIGGVTFELDPGAATR